MAAMNSNHSPFKFLGTCVDRNSLSHTHKQKHTIKCTHTQNLRTWPISLLEALIRVVDRRGKKEKTLACRALLSIKEAKAFFFWLHLQLSYQSGDEEMRGGKKRMGCAVALCPPQSNTQTCCKYTTQTYILTHFSLMKYKILSCLKNHKMASSFYTSW